MKFERRAKSWLFIAIGTTIVLNYLLAILIPILPFVAVGVLLIGIGWLVYSRRSRI